MAWFFKSDVEEKVEKLDNTLRESFDRVKEDTNNLYEWIRYLQEQNKSLHSEVKDHKRAVEAHKEEIRKLSAELRQLPITREDIKKVVDSHYDFEGLLNRIRELESSIVQLQRKAPVRAAPMREAPQARTALQEKIDKRITRHSKEYVKGMILNLVQRYGKASALQLREMVVDEQGLCSKSSFYRMLEELEKEGSLGALSSGKEKVYLAEKATRK